METLPLLAPAAGVGTDLATAARDVLAANWRGRHTVPSARLYPHQWSWDSAFIAIGLARVDQHRAQLEKNAEERVKGFLVIRELAKRENIEATKEEIAKAKQG